ncbi:MULTISPECIES: hypothetical protein [Burkholderiaceae]|uniref:hypothetical protein n=1 Tax=Burkholderiaceae TaxID=119060 RepID=UPI0009632272|nr:MULTISPECIES: hypothetical protein [Burkholderiaceae]MCG1040898.1 hypothetical protein [Mycetohabitans sp. B7]SIT64868.1 hypothetical protein SAMN04487769_0071 [Burkholderia sp. b14]
MMTDPIEQEQHFVLDARDIAWHLRRWQSETAKCPFKGELTWDKVWFPQGVESLIRALQDGTKLEPHQAFLIAFLETLKTPQALLNTFAARHRDLYYRQALGLTERPARPDRVAVSMQLAPQWRERLVAAGTLLDGGQDHEHTPQYYALDQDLLANAGQLTDLRWCQPAPNVPGASAGLARVVMSEQQPWPNAGVRLFATQDSEAASTNAEYPIATGRVLSLAALALAGGVRTLTLTFDEAVAVNQLQASVSGRGKWLALNNIDAASEPGTTAVFQLGADAPAVEASPGLDGWPGEGPFLKLLHMSAQPVPAIEKIEIAVSQPADVRFSTDEGLAKLTEKNYPFGQSPVIGSGVYLAAPDWGRWCGKKITMTLMLEWLDLPNVSFEKWYENYGVTLKNESFKIRASLGQQTTTDYSPEPLAIFDTKQGEANLEAPQAKPLEWEFDAPAHALPDSLDPRDGPYLRLELAEHDFLHQAYWTHMMNPPTDGTSQQVWNAPYTPQLKRAQLSYRTTYSLSKADAQFVLTPFGYVHDDDAQPVTARTLFLGFTGLKPGQDLDLWWQLKSPQGQALHWSYLRQDNVWCTLDSQVRDTTEGFSQSGLWHVVLPHDASTTASAMPRGRYWLACRFEGINPLLSDPSASSDMPLLVGLCVNAVTATRISGVDPLRVAGSVTRTVQGLDGIQGVIQRWNSEGGQTPETTSDFYRRAAKRLSHRDRALTWRDIKRLLLDRFPALYEVRVVDTVAKQQLVVVPKPGEQDNGDPLKPMLNTTRLKAMQDDILGRASPWLNIELCNPGYRDILVDYTLVFRDGLNPEYSYAQVKKSLSRRYMPWGEAASTHPVTLGDTLDYYQLFAELQQLPWVTSVTDLKIDGGDKSIAADGIEVLILKFPEPERATVQAPV